MARLVGQNAPEASWRTAPCDVQPAHVLTMRRRTQERKRVPVTHVTTLHVTGTILCNVAKKSTSRLMAAPSQRALLL